MKEDEVESVLYKTVKNCSGTGIITFPKALIGQEVKIVFSRKLTEYEKKSLELNKLRQDLNEIKRRKKSRKK
jgi:putative transposon-encoded protein